MAITIIKEHSSLLLVLRFKKKLIFHTLKVTRHNHTDVTVTPLPCTGSFKLNAQRIAVCSVLPAAFSLQPESAQAASGQAAGLQALLHALLPCPDAMP
ncbi:hypothetical protein [Anaerobiospirillum sp. NML120511]|uniref:hypothetical protein n=1 Tax=Anaerobiospirillum sp. NML120511 TaxID=2932819 RepID=UPI001FF212CD|nr:hypothetical protein [Anaerobiospirillum sp. NML120511]MCK0533729.1 hypothetical protein [Anaerobiospirillum sp. NML120511]